MVDSTYSSNKNIAAEDCSGGGGVMDDFGVDLVQDAKDRMTSWTRDTTNTTLDSQSWSLSYESDWDTTTEIDGGVGTTQGRTHNGKKKGQSLLIPTLAAMSTTCSTVVMGG